MNKKTIFIILNSYCSKPIKCILEKMLYCNVKTIYDIDKENIDINEYILSSYMQALDNDCDIILDNNDDLDYKYIKRKLNDLDYDCNIYNIKNKKYKIFKNINPKLNILKYIRYSILIKIVTCLLKRIDNYVRNNIGFEINEGNFERIEKTINNNLCKKDNIFSILKKYFYYINRLHVIAIDKPKTCFKVGIISNDYIPIDLYNNYVLEKKLAIKNIESQRFNHNINQSKIKTKFQLFKIKKYCKYNIGSNVINNIYRTIKLINQEYDGIILIKNNKSIYDISTTIIIENICKKENIPLIILNINKNTNNLYIENNINVFYDMIILNKNSKKML